MKKEIKKIATIIVIAVITFMSACAPSKKSAKAPAQIAEIQILKNDTGTVYSALTLTDLEGLTAEQAKGLQVYISHQVTMSRSEPYRTKEVRNGILYWVDSFRTVTKTINALTKGQITIIKNPGSAAVELATSFDKEDKALTLKFYNDGTGNLVLVMADDHIAIRDGFKYEVSTLATDNDKCKLLFIGKGEQGSSNTTVTAKGNPVGNTVILKTSPNSNPKIILPAKPVRDSM